jgi:hypothetical protein
MIERCEKCNKEDNKLKDGYALNIMDAQQWCQECIKAEEFRREEFIRKEFRNYRLLLFEAMQQMRYGR